MISPQRLNLRRRIHKLLSMKQPRKCRLPEFLLLLTDVLPRCLQIIALYLRRTLPKRIVCLRYQWFLRLSVEQEARVLRASIYTGSRVDEMVLTGTDVVAHTSYFHVLVSLLPHSDLLGEFHCSIGFVYNLGLLLENLESLLLTVVFLLVVHHLEAFFALVQLVQLVNDCNTFAAEGKTHPCTALGRFDRLSFG